MNEAITAKDILAKDEWPKWSEEKLDTGASIWVGEGMPFYGPVAGDPNATLGQKVVKVAISPDGRSVVVLSDIWRPVKE